MDDECPVCTNVTTQTSTLTLRCGHRFCSVCIGRWMDISPLADCPTCRAPIHPAPNSSDELGFERQWDIFMEQREIFFDNEATWLKEYGVGKWVVVCQGRLVGVYDSEVVAHSNIDHTHLAYIARLQFRDEPNGCQILFQWLTGIVSKIVGMCM